MILRFTTVIICSWLYFFEIEVLARVVLEAFPKGLPRKEEVEE